MDFSAVLKSKIISQIPFIKQKGENEEDERKMKKLKRVLFIASFLFLTILRLFVLPIQIRIYPSISTVLIIHQTALRFCFADPFGVGSVDIDNDDRFYKDRNRAVVYQKRARSAANTAQSVLIGLALFLTLFLMSPILKR